jgi:transmembrane 9 superfamily protein 2/4
LRCTRLAIPLQHDSHGTNQQRTVANEHNLKFSFQHHTTLLFLIICVSKCYTFYVPGMAPADFKAGDPIEVKAVKMTSIHTQLPYEYYSLPFCLPKGGLNAIHYKSENLGEVLRGDRIVNTPYDVKMAKNTPCTLCATRRVIQSIGVWGSHKSSSIGYSTSISCICTLKLKIGRFKRNLFVFCSLVDNLPAATPVFNPEVNDFQYEHGYKLGNTVGDRNYINNHLKLTLLYHNPTP